MQGARRRPTGRGREKQWLTGEEQGLTGGRRNKQRLTEGRVEVDRERRGTSRARFDTGKVTGGSIHREGEMICSGREGDTSSVL